MLPTQNKQVERWTCMYLMLNKRQQVEKGKQSGDSYHHPGLLAI